MALNCYVEMTGNGEALDGFSTVHEMGGEDVSSNHIECYEVDFGTVVGAESQSVYAASHRRMLPVTFRKRVDGTTPLLYQFLKTNATIEATFKFFHTNPESGETELLFSLGVTGGRVIQIKTVNPNTLDSDNANLPFFEQIQVMPQTVRYSCDTANTESEDSWQQQA